MPTARLALLALAASLAVAAERPNFVVILADDLAWSDLGCYGSLRCETPRLDGMAAEGMRFTDAYAAAPLCSPSRAALLTGKSPARLRFEFVTKWPADTVPSVASRPLTPPPYTFELPLEERTLAEVLRDAGYRTGMAGKWHLNAHHETYLGWSPTHGPLQQGFEWAEESFGSHPWAFAKPGDEPFGKLRDGEYAPDSLTDAAIGFIQRRDERPFFLYLAYPYVHTPVRTRGPWLVDKYRRKLGPSATEKQVLYGGFVETLDRHVGRLLDAIDRAGLHENTVVVFTSDNGGHPEFAANAPLRGGKWNLYEGGVRVPLLVRGPGVARGATTGAPVTGMDLFDTLADLAGAADRAPDALSLAPLLAGRGNAGSFERRELVWHFPYYHPEKGFDESPPAIGAGDGYVSQTRPTSSIRVGRRKLIHYWEDGRAELFDLDADRAERHDLSGERPTEAEALRRRLLAALDAMGARRPARN